MASAALSLFTSVLGGIFKHHAVAVKNEADALNYAVPATEQSWGEIMAALNSGQIDIPTASGLIDQSLSQYEDAVYSQFHVKRKDCNGPCVVEQALQRNATKIKALINSGAAGSVSLEKTYGNAGYQGTPDFVLTYTGPVSTLLGANGNIVGGVEQALTGTIQIGTAKVPVVYIIIGGFIVLLALVLESGSRER